MRRELTVSSFLLVVSAITAFAAADVKLLEVKRAITPEGQKCIDCHAEQQPGIVSDWRQSRHGHVGMSCIDCHGRAADSPMATQCEGIKGTETYMSVMVTPKTCAKCHPEETKQFNESGHFRARAQIIPKKGLHALMYKHEGQDYPGLKESPDETGCMQCHGSVVKLGKDNKPLPGTWPVSGVGTIWPDGSQGSCTVCHTRHKFNISESRKPEACASCHLGPDHPNIEIFRNSKHGQMYAVEGDTWKFDSMPDAWEPGDYRSPTCAVCHMGGIGELKTTHNVSSRLKWNLWAKSSKLRNSNDPMSPITGDAEAGRAAMKSVCANCHSKTFYDGFFKQADKHVMLYNKAYYEPAKKMLDELKAKKLVRTDNPWKDPFLVAFYYLWHHDGRRMRQGAMMGAPDYAHWHGSFDGMQKLYKMEKIHKKRLETNKIED